MAEVLGDGLGFRASVAVRVNALGSEWFTRRAELVALAGPAIASLVIPKVESAEDVRWLDRRWTARRAATSASRRWWRRAAGLAARRRDRRGRRPPRRADPRLRRPRGVAGPGRARRAAGALAARAGRPSWWPRAPPGIQAIDGPYLAIRDDGRAAARAAHARTLGFDGKWAVHPDQLEAINDGLHAGSGGARARRRVVAALDERPRRRGRGRRAR